MTNTAATAAELAAYLINEIHVQETRVRRHIPASETIIDSYIRLALSGESPHRVAADLALAGGLANMTAAQAVQIQFTGQDAATRRLWQRTRYVYDVDPDTWLSLGDARGDMKLPADTFTRLPHPDPFVRLPNPITLPLPDGQRQKVVGFFITGAAPGVFGSFQVSTADGWSAGVRLLFAGLVESADGSAFMVGKQRDIAWTRISLNPADGTVNTMIENSLARFTPTVQGGDWRNDVPVLVRSAVSLLVYLCADNADTQTVRAFARGRARDGRRRAPKPATLVRVGYRVGAALRAHRRAQQAGDPVSTGRKVAPHIRRAHPHLYWVGKGRTEQRIRWVWPVRVNMPEDPPLTTVVRA
jgi:hypothetical protein